MTSLWIHLRELGRFIADGFLAILEAIEWEGRR